MNCPVCNVELKMSERQGVEIDYCPQCRGVWLDRGELDKIIERSSAVGAPPPAASAPRYNSDREGYSPRERYDDDYERKDYNKSKRKSFLGDLFDF